MALESDELLVPNSSSSEDGLLIRRHSSVHELGQPIPQPQPHHPHPDDNNSRRHSSEGGHGGQPTHHEPQHQHHHQHHRPHSPHTYHHHARPHSPPHSPSPWYTNTMTPMTTRPYFAKPHSPRGLRRVRSRSLGAEVEANFSVEDFRSLLAPSLHENHGLVLAEDEDEEQIVEILTPESVRSKSSIRTSPNGQHLQQQESVETAKQQYDDEKEEEIKNPAWICVVYGLINATIVLPVLMSFGAIIYRDEAFSPYMPVLVKLTLVSGVVHQLCFSTFSSLPFAVGQVQDAGLIFLSSMASYIVQYCRANGHDDATMLATATVGLSLCTALLGCGLLLVGRLGLAQYVQMLPTCVVGGYLAYIGWFCGISGVGLMAGSSQVTLKLVAENIRLVLPGVCGGIFIYASVRKMHHMAVLPTCILFLLVLFYAVLLLTGSTIEEATDRGWVRKMDPPPPFARTWDFLRFDKVAWAALPNLVLTELSMIFVVALSSSLDVAAIELEMGQPLNYNHELSMVGVSNLVSGLTGGYTGSYIFSQSIFSLRAGIRSRLAGYVLALSQIVVLVLPVPILSYVPNFFFGSLLSMICVDLMYEWLWDVKAKLTLVEYVLCLSTFGLILVLGVEYGILAGVILYYFCRKVLGLDVGEGKIVMREGEDEDEDDGGDDDEITNAMTNGSSDHAGEGEVSFVQYGSMS